MGRVHADVRRLMNSTGVVVTSINTPTNLMRNRFCAERCGVLYSGTGSQGCCLRVLYCALDVDQC